MMSLVSILSELGVSYSALPMYLGELAPKNLRGALATMTEVFVITGVLLAQIFSLQAILGNATGNQQHEWVGWGEGKVRPMVQLSPNLTNRPNRKVFW